MDDKAYTVLNLGLKKLLGYKYTLLDDGRIYRRKWKCPRWIWKCPLCFITKHIFLMNRAELVDLSHLKLKPEEYPIKRQPGWFYYLSKEGDLMATPWKGGEEFRKKVFKDYFAPVDVDKFDPEAKVRAKKMKLLNNLIRASRQWKELTGEPIPEKLVQAASHYDL